MIAQYRPIRLGQHRSTVQPKTIDRHLIVPIDNNIIEQVYSSSLLYCVLMIYVFTKLRLDIHWGQCNLSLGRGLLIFSLFMSFIKCFKKFLLSQDGDNELFQFSLII